MCFILYIIMVARPAKVEIRDVFIVPSDGMWNKFHASYWLSEEKQGKILSLRQWDAWNLFHVTSNGATSFNINKS